MFGCMGLCRECVNLDSLLLRLIEEVLSWNASVHSTPDLCGAFLRNVDMRVGRMCKVAVSGCSIVEIVWRMRVERHRERDISI